MTTGLVNMHIDRSIANLSIKNIFMVGYENGNGHIVELVTSQSLIKYA